MAIQVSGTQVIGNSRELTNIASVDATTAASITAAGVGGGGSIDFVAKGTVSDGTPVSINSDGTVSIDPGDATISAQTGLGTGNWSSAGAVYDTNSNKMVLCYATQSDSYYGKAVVATVSGTSISFGTPVTFYSGSTGYICPVFDSNSNKIVITYKAQSSSNHGQAVVGTVSGTSISFGSASTFNNAEVYYAASCFDSNSNKVVVAYRDDGASSRGYSRVGTVSGTSISWGSEVLWYANSPYELDIAFDSNVNKVLVCYADASGFRGAANVGTVSGTSISWAGNQIFDSNQCISTMSATFDSTANKIVIAHKGGSTGNNHCTLATLSASSGAQATFSTPLQVSANLTNKNVVYDSGNNKVLYFISNYVYAGTISGNTISFGDPEEYDDSGAMYFSNYSADYDPDAERSVLFWTDQLIERPYYTLVNSAGLGGNFTWIGVAAEAIADGATGAITVVGGVNESQSGLTTGSLYYLDENGALTTTVTAGREVGRALNATDLLITQGSLTA